MGRFAAFAVAAPLVLAACGQSASGVTAVESAAIAPTTTTPVEPTAAASNPPAGYRVCDVEWTTISTAIEAHYAQYMFDVSTIDELVPEYLRARPLGWSLVIDADGIPAVTADADGRCGGYDPDAPAPETTEPPAPAPGSIACYDQQIVLEVASNAVFAETGERPTSQASLVEDGLLIRELDAYGYDATGNVILTMSGRCELPEGGVGPFLGADPSCYTDWFSVMVANQFHVHYTGEPASSSALFRRGYTAREIVTYDTDADGVTIATGTRGCPTLGQSSTAEQAADTCDVELRTLETAIEAYAAQRLAEPAALSDLVPDYIVAAPKVWTIVFPAAADDTIVITPVEGGPCDD